MNEISTDTEVHEGFDSDNVRDRMTTANTQLQQLKILDKSAQDLMKKCGVAA